MLSWARACASRVRVMRSTFLTRCEREGRTRVRVGMVVSMVAGMVKTWIFCAFSWAKRDTASLVELRPGY